MSQVTFKGTLIKISGNPPVPGTKAADFTAVANDLSERKLTHFAGKVVILASVPSLDTGVCDKETRRFNETAGQLGAGAAVVTVSRDLPFAQKRWCGAAGVSNVTTVSDFRDHAFGKAYGVEITSGPLAGLLARAVWVIDKQGVIQHAQLVPEIVQEPDYDAVLATARKLL